jgi:bifunctional ADP-heptose synthase (sugar kinase/adenylyltransferase)
MATEALVANGVTPATFVDPSRPTTVNERFLASGKTLLRVNHLRHHPIDGDVAQRMLAHVEQVMPRTDLVMFCDLNYGCLSPELITRVTEMAATHCIMTAAASHASSRPSDVSRFRDMMLIVTTEHEARLALRDFESGLVVVTEKLKAAGGAQNAVVTLGTEGILVHAAGHGEYTTDRLPAFNVAPKDLVGADDSLFSCMALALRAGIDIWPSAYLGALAAACQASRVGNSPLTLSELASEIEFPGFDDI